MPVSSREPTRERLLSEARRLFAEHGYDGTSVGDIEAGAGLVPRRGALYKHFANKEDVLRAVLARHTQVGDEVAATWEFDASDPQGQLEGLARTMIAELRSVHDLTRIVMNEGQRFPELTAAFREAIVFRGHRSATELLEGYVAATGAELADPEATATVICDSVVGYTLNELLFGPAPAGVDEDRFVAAWAQANLAILKGATP